ncbi:succinate dehydrogenase, cytochrome b556 subunit [Parvibaculaceae bacterium PLY_AMNH_Bact1]|nr:succinate dehydrogenase, cytochrome b556 subunit [Parvibaculaceae bacterium PLY_AMNH_Bact1]
MAETSVKAPGRARPLSPHMGIYRPMLTMMMSIVHRITGGALYFGTLLLAWWLIAAATGPEAYGVFMDVATSWFGRLVLIGYTWALIHHLLGGVRHFIWDMGKGFELRTVEWLARLTLAGSLVLTVVVWLVAYAMAGVI